METILKDIFFLCSWELMFPKHILEQILTTQELLVLKNNGFLFVSYKQALKNFFQVHRIYFFSLFSLWEQETVTMIHNISLDHNFHTTFRSIESL